MNHSPFSFNSIGKGVRALLFISWAVFICQKVMPGTLEYYFGLVPAKVLGGLAVWRLFTYIFLHGSFLHLLLNSFMIWMFGKELEAAWGTKEFLKFFMLCGIGAGVCNVAFEPFNLFPIVGASGAIYGVLAAYAVLFPNTVIYLYAVIPLYAKHFVILMGLFEFFASFDGMSSGIARLAHLGGLVTGYLYLKSYEFRSILGRMSRKFLSTIFVTDKPARRLERGRPQEKDLFKEVDRILEKVLAHGVQSLTPEEQKILRQYSTRNKNRT